MSDEQSTSPFLPRFHIFSHKLKLKLVKKLHLEIRGGGLQNPQDPPSYGPATAGTVRATHDVRTVPVRCPYDCMSHGHHEATVRTSCGARTVIVGIARASCDFFECKNITKSYGDRKNITMR